MQGKGLSLRLSLVALVVVLVFGALGGFSLARDAFDADYNDCPATTRLDAVDGLTIDRTDEDDEIRISWDSLDSADLSGLGPNGYKARLTVIVDGEDARNVALGDTNLVIDDIDFAEDLTVSVAVTLGDYVISDIAEADFTSGLPAPRFSTDIRVSRNAIEAVVDGNKADVASDQAIYAVWRKTVRVNDEDEGVTDGVSEALLTGEGIDDDGGFDEDIENATDGGARQLAIDGISADEAFAIDLLQLGTSDEIEARAGRATAAGEAAANKEIDRDDGAVIVNGKMLDLGTFYYIGFNDLFDNWYAETGVEQRPKSPRFRVGLQHGASGVNAGDADFENYRIVIEDSSGDLLSYQAETVPATRAYGSNKIVFSSNGVDPLPPFVTNVQFTATDFSNIRLSNQVTEDGKILSPYYNRADDFRPVTLDDDLTFGNVGLVDAKTDKFPALNVIYADAPVEYFDFPSDLFEADGNYTLKAWAEDDDGTRISPQASIKIGAQEQEAVTNAAVGGYANGIRDFGTVGTNKLIVYGFSIQDE